MLRCPWLRKLPNQDKYACRIYFDRPDECKHYPTTISEMIRDGCEMLEPRDLKDPGAAQKRLGHPDVGQPATGESVSLVTRLTRRTVRACC